MLSTFLAILVLAPLSGAALHPKLSSPWNITVFLEDGQITSGDSLSIVVRLENRTDEPVELFGSASVRRVANAATQPSTSPMEDDSKALSSTRPSSPLVTSPFDGLPRTEIILEGPFSVPLRPLLTTKSERLGGRRLESNEDLFLVASLPAGSFAKGDYTIRAVLIDGRDVVAASREHALHVIEETPDAAARRLRPIEGTVPRGTILAK